MNTVHPILFDLTDAERKKLSAKELRYLGIHPANKTVPELVRDMVKNLDKRTMFNSKDALVYVYRHANKVVHPSYMYKVLTDIEKTAVVRRVSSRPTVTYEVA